MNTVMYGPITSTSQIQNATSKLDLARIDGQPMPLIARTPGVGADHIVYVAPDFDDALEFNV
jgi:hypothetical protein